MDSSLHLPNRFVDWQKTLGMACANTAPSELGDYYLMAGELVSYKRPDLAVRVFNEMKLRLVVIGGGEMFDEIRHLAALLSRLWGRSYFDVLKQHYARCRALIFPGKEDFGMVPVEAMVSGRPVAFGRGGATETFAKGGVRCLLRLRRPVGRDNHVGGQRFGEYRNRP
jgi:glycosyltransferase involved in cell wall biosynthesis